MQTQNNSYNFNSNLQMSTNFNSWPSEEDIVRFNTIFQNLSHNSNPLDNQTLKPIFLSSNLNGDILFRIWNQVDINKIGQLNQEQFLVAMLLIQRAKMIGRLESEQDVARLFNIVKQKLVSINNMTNFNPSFNAQSNAPAIDFNSNPIQPTIAKEDAKDDISKRIESLKERIEKIKINKNLTPKQTIKRSPEELNQLKQRIKTLYEKVPIYHPSFFPWYHDQISKPKMNLSPSQEEALLLLIENVTKWTSSSLNRIENDIKGAVEQRYNLEIEYLKRCDALEFGYNYEENKKEASSTTEDEDEKDPIKARAKKMLKERMAQLNLNLNPTSNNSQGVEQRIESKRQNLELECESTRSKLNQKLEQLNELHQKFTELQQTILPSTHMKAKIICSEQRAFAHAAKVGDKGNGLMWFVKELEEQFDKLEFPKVEKKVDNVKSTEDVVNSVKEDEDKVLFEKDRDLTSNEVAEKVESKVEKVKELFKEKEQKQPEEEKPSEEPSVTVSKSKVEDTIPIPPPQPLSSLLNVTTMSKVQSNNPFLMNSDSASSQPKEEAVKKPNNNPFLKAHTPPLELDADQTNDVKLDKKESETEEHIEKTALSSHNSLLDTKKDDFTKDVLYVVEFLYDYLSEETGLHFDVGEHACIIEENGEWLLGFKEGIPDLEDWLPKDYTKRLDKDSEKQQEDHKNMAAEEFDQEVHYVNELSTSNRIEDEDNEKGAFDATKSYYEHNYGTDSLPKEKEESIHDTTLDESFYTTIETSFIDSHGQAELNNENKSINHAQSHNEVNVESNLDNYAQYPKATLLYEFVEEENNPPITHHEGTCYYVLEQNGEWWLCKPILKKDSLNDKQENMEDEGEQDLVYLPSSFMQLD